MTKLFVGNLSFEVTRDDLRAAFAAHGQVSSANVVIDRSTGESKGFGFVEMPQAEAVAAIQALNGTSLKGRALTVSRARPRDHASRERGSSGWAIIGEARHRW